MLDSIRRFVSDRLAGDSIGATDDATGGSGGPTPLQLAACALLLELAHADGEVSAEEETSLQEALERHFGLDRQTGAELLQLAETERSQSLDHFQFTRLIASEYDSRQKLDLATAMWSVILADGRLTDLETHLVRKMGSLMQVDPAVLAAARRAAEAGLS